MIKIGDWVTFFDGTKEKTGIIRNINKRFLRVTVQTEHSMYRVPINLIKIETDMKKFPKLPEFNLGEAVQFIYKGKVIQGYIRKINKTTMTIDSELGRVRANPTRISPINLENPLILPKETKKSINSKTNKIRSYQVSNSSVIEELSDSMINKMELLAEELSRGLKNKNDNLINVSANKIALLFTNYYILPPVKIYTKGKRIRGKKNQTLGVHRTKAIGSKNQRSSISVFSKTAVRNQYVKPKTYLNTLFHELIHHYDRYFLNIPYSYHTKGFYQRLNTIYNPLKSGF